MRLLDVGCGIGGTSRMAAMAGAEVTGIDLSPEFVATATDLTERVGLADRVTFLTTPGESLPLDDGVRRGRDGARRHEHPRQAGGLRGGAPGAGPRRACSRCTSRCAPARRPALSAPLGRGRALVVRGVGRRLPRHLEAAGFTVEEVEDRTASTLGPPPAAGRNAVVFGEDFVQRIGNNIAATKAGLLGAVAGGGAGLSGCGAKTAVRPRTRDVSRVWQPAHGGGLFHGTAAKTLQL